VSVLTLAITTPASAVGEDVLAHTGQYTFFIKPDPCSHVTYYQKMVPCMERKVESVPQTVINAFPVPVVARKRQRVVISETPVGHAKGSGPCVECYPRAICKPAVKEVLLPTVVPVNVPGVIFNPRCTERRVIRPQWFAVEEHPAPPPRKVRKVRSVR